MSAILATVLLLTNTFQSIPISTSNYCLPVGITFQGTISGLGMDGKWKLPSNGALVYIKAHTPTKSVARCVFDSLLILRPELPETDKLNTDCGEGNALSVAGNDPVIHMCEQVICEEWEYCT